MGRPPGLVVLMEHGVTLLQPVHLVSVYSTEFSRCSIFADCHFKKLRGNNLNNDSASINLIWHSKISHNFIFEVRYHSTKNVKIMCLENAAFRTLLK